MFGPLIGGQIILSQTSVVNQSNSSLYIPYIIIGCVVVVLAILFYFANVPDIHAEEELKAVNGTKTVTGLWKRKHFSFGVLSQFLYVAAQTGIFSFFINYFVENSNNMSDRVASKWLAFGGFGLFLLGRLIGSQVMRYMKPHTTLATYSFINVLMMIVVMTCHGKIGNVALLLSFFFMSIMFPTNFALAIKGLGEQTKKASSFIVMSIVGGAIVPMLMGRIADVSSMRVGFIVPLICFIVVGLYGARWQTLDSSDIKKA
jgi:FHS family L-fucose permease-like MFS transporter